MGVRENKVETYLRDRIKLLGGDTRKWVSPGRDGVPDQVVLVYYGVFFCEVKTPDGKLSPTQIREHARLRKLGALVCTVWGAEGVDLLIKDLKNWGSPTSKIYGWCGEEVYLMIKSEEEKEAPVAEEIGNYEV